MHKALFALALGAFGFSASEYTMVGVLSDVAASLHLPMARAGDLLSAYALGVVAGALLLATLARAAAPKKTLLWLAAFFALGNMLTASSDGYWSVLSMRFLSGLPHGGFFAVASLAAERLSVKGKSAGAVAALFSGMTVATLAGVPLCTFLSHWVSWRLAYLLIGLCGLVSFWATDKYLPSLPAAPKTDLKQEASFLSRPKAWIILLGVILGNGGLFCWISYLSPFMRYVSKVPAGLMGAVMVLTGAGMLLGNWLSGRATERLTPIRAAAWVQAFACVNLALLFFFPYNPWVSCALAFMCCGLMFALTVPEQMLLISAAPGGALLGSAVAQAGFYLGNTLGAFGGGLALEAGLGYRYTSLFGLIAGTAGLFFLLWYARGARTPHAPKVAGVMPRGVAAGSAKTAK